MADWSNTPDDAASSQPDPQPSDGIHEEDVISGDSDSPPERVAHSVDHVLQQISARFSTTQTTAEVMIPTQDGVQLLSQDVRPETAPLLFARIRAGQSVCWKAYTSRVPQLYRRPEHEGYEQAPGAAASRSAPTRLSSSQVALSIPILYGGDVVGVLNLESQDRGALTETTEGQLQQAGLLTMLAQALHEIPHDTISDAAVAELLIQKMQNRIAFTISRDCSGGHPVERRITAQECILNSLFAGRQR